MPTYSSPAKLGVAYPELAVIQDTGLLNWALTMADAEVNGYVARRYSLPLPAVPLLEQIATDIAVYLIVTSRPMGIPPFPAAPQASEMTWETRYKTAISMLQKIADEDMVLVGADETVIDPGSDISNRASSSTMNFVPTMGEASDQTFRVDPNKVDAELGRRV